MGSDKNSSGISVSVTGDGGKLAISDNVVDHTGSALSILFSKRVARARIDQAMATRLSQKIEAGDYEFGPTERAFLGILYSKALRQFENQRRMLERAEEFLPETRVRLLPSSLDSSPPTVTSDDWVERILEDAARVSEDGVRDLYARIAAGEVVRPGMFSMKTLSVVLDLDSETVESWRRIHPLVFEKQFLIPYDKIPVFYRSRNLTYETFVHLESCGLIKLDDRSLSTARAASLATTLDAQVTYGDRTIKYRAESMSALCFDAWGLTPVGKQLLTVSPVVHDEDFFQKLIAYIGQAEVAHLVSDSSAFRHDIAWTEDGVEWNNAT